MKNFYFSNMKNAMELWKMFSLATYRHQCEYRKARVVECMRFSCMSDHHRALLRWKKNARSATMYIYGEQIKAGYILDTVVSRVYHAHRTDLLR